MAQRRIFTLFAPMAVLYSLALIASFGGIHGAKSLMFSGFALLCSLLPLRLSTQQLRGYRRISSLSLMSAIVLLCWVAPPPLAWLKETILPVALSGMATLLVDLALSVPEHPAWAGKIKSFRLLNVVVGIVVASLSVIAAAPAFGGRAEPWMLSSRFSYLSWWLFAMALGVGLLLRVYRQWWSRDGKSGSATLWTTLGLIVGWAGIVALAVLFVFGEGKDQSSAFSWLLLAVIVFINASHTLLVESRWRLNANKSLRKSLALVFSLVVVGLFAASLGSRFPTRPLPLFAILVALMLSAAIVFRVIERIVQFVFRPDRGRLLDAVERSYKALIHNSDSEAVCQNILREFRLASRAPSAQPWLVVFAPDNEMTLGAAGWLQTTHGHRFSALQHYFLDQIQNDPGSFEEKRLELTLVAAKPPSSHPVVLRSKIQALEVRRPELRAVIAEIVGVDALCVIPLVEQAELQGFVMIPKGKRKAELSEEESDELQVFAEVLATRLSLIAMHEQVLSRALSERIQREAKEEQLFQLQDEKNRLTDLARFVEYPSESRVSPSALISYSPPMRALQKQIEVLAPLDIAVLIESASAIEAKQLAFAIHNKQRAEVGPFVWIDCHELSHKSSDDFFSTSADANHAALLQTARGGSLVLHQAAALSVSVQQMLARVLAEGQLPNGEPLFTRIMISLPPVDDFDLPILDESLWSRIVSARCVVPALRDRKEDLESLLHFYVQQSALKFAKKVPVIEGDVLDCLAAYDWPFDLEEFELVVSSAMRRVKNRFTSSLLPPHIRQARGQHTEKHPFDGSYAELEQRILMHALAKANGNKSKAARALGLKRTTFIDKLRRFELDENEKTQAQMPDLFS
ncbi:MAG: sigma 54-interacting transcriptional regulator [Myxococcales bacterium]|nr:MAG: sigma 54-interacting transcriptional regulator [Myxococcales bacterium]